MTDTPRETILADIRERLAKAGGPWRLTHRYPMMVGHGIALQRAREIQHEAETGQIFGLYIGRAHDLPLDAFEFIAHAPDDIRALLAECDTLRAQLAALRDAHNALAYDKHELQSDLKQAEAQLAAREGEIATLTIQYEQAEAEVLRRHEREDRLKEEALSWRRVSERLQGERLATEARADTAEAQLRAQAQERQRLADASIARPSITKESQPHE